MKPHRSKPLDTRSLSNLNTLLDVCFCSSMISLTADNLPKVQQGVSQPHWVIQFLAQLNTIHNCRQSGLVLANIEEHITEPTVQIGSPVSHE